MVKRIDPPYVRSAAEAVKRMAELVFSKNDSSEKRYAGTLLEQGEQTSMFDRPYAQRADGFASTLRWKLEAVHAIVEIEKLQVVKPRVMDWGCNTGRFIDLAEKKLIVPKVQWVAMDPNPSALQYLEDRISEEVGERLETTIDLQSIADSSLDAVVCLHALPQMHDVKTELSNVRDKMKSGAKMIAMIHNPWYEWIRWPLNVWKGYRHDATVNRHWTRNEFWRAMWEAGFIPDRIEYVGDGWGPFRRRLLYVGSKP